MIASAALAVAWAAASATASIGASTAPAARPFQVAGYLPAWRFESVKPERLAGLTDLIIFSLQLTPAGEIDFGDLNMASVKKYQEAKKRIGYRIWVSIGGWGRSGGFAPTAKDPASRKKFISELLVLMQKEGFDGVDFDWEHPKGEAELSDYAKLVSETKKALAPKKKLVAAAVPGWLNVPSPVFKDLDRVIVMAYDHQGQHATVEGAQQDVDQFIRRGAPAWKMLMGVPFYGRGLADWSQAKGYSEIRRLFSPDPNTDEAGGFYFNGPETLKRKVQICRERGLAGVVIWEVGQDVSGDGSLLKVIADTAKNSVSVQINPRPLPNEGAKPNDRVNQKNEKNNTRGGIGGVKPKPRPAPTKPAIRSTIKGSTAKGSTAKVSPVKGTTGKAKPKPSTQTSRKDQTPVSRKKTGA